MKKLMLLLCLIFICISCLKKITCDKFNLHTSLQDNTLYISIESDLPDYTNIIVSISRSYWQKGETDEYSSIKYFTEKSNLKKWKNTKKILLDNTRWKAKLKIREDRMVGKGDLEYQVSKINDNISVDVTVIEKQSNSAFGKNNKNLIGNEVKTENIHVVRKRKEIIYPLSINEKLTSNIKKKEKKLDGKWIDNKGSPNIIHVYEKNGIIHVNTHWSSGSIYKQTAFIKTINNEKRYYVSDSSMNEYFIFGKSNEMRWYDDFGLFEVCKKQ
ncbi:MAG: hypothetical protein HQ534_12320 [Armatimonadetes bacterium]|nr:hypothetical protein [Armatimonadota bacterium]